MWTRPMVCIGMDESKQVRDHQWFLLAGVNGGIIQALYSRGARRGQIRLCTLIRCDLKICDLRTPHGRRSVMVSTLALFNEVNRHWAWSLLGLVTVCGQINRLSTMYVASHLGRLEMYGPVAGVGETICGRPWILRWFVCVYFWTEAGSWPWLENTRVLQKFLIKFQVSVTF